VSTCDGGRESVPPSTQVLSNGKADVIGPEIMSALGSRPLARRHHPQPAHGMQANSDKLDANMMRNAKPFLGDRTGEASRPGGAWSVNQFRGAEQACSE